MTDISKLKDLSPPERKSLEAQQITNVEQLWTKVGESPAKGKGIDDLATASGIAPERLTAVLVTEALRSEREWPLVSSLGDIAQTTHPKRTCFLVVLSLIVTILL
ncbi:MAG TPA: hypothetical protein VND68_07635, partial [Chloroflexia bacterium]|nr:hypothetical protein [Chloroflexia bacterium]